MDRMTQEQRSKTMAAVRSRGNKSTELILASIFRKNGIVGWRRHHRLALGTPDFLFAKQKLVVFVDGCFWHGCKKHRSIPITNRRFWFNKIKRNQRKDKTVNAFYRDKNWKVIRIWEHELKNVEGIINKFAL